MQHNGYCPDGQIPDFPLLPQMLVHRAEEMHEGKLWAWVATCVQGRHILAVAVANMPGMRTIRAVAFDSHEEAEIAASVHNGQRGISEAQAGQIVASSVIAEHELAALATPEAKHEH